MFCSKCGTDQESFVNSPKRSKRKIIICVVLAVSLLITSFSAYLFVLHNQKVYKLPTVIHYVDEDATDDDDREYTVKTDFVFSDKDPTEDGVWYLTMERNHIVKAVCNSSVYGYDEYLFEYNEDDLPSKITYKSDPDEVSGIELIIYKNNKEFSFQTYGSTYAPTWSVSVDDHNWDTTDTEYDEFGNIISTGNSVYRWILSDEKYDDNHNIISGTVNLYNTETNTFSDFEESLTIEYDADQYPVVERNGNITFDFSYTKYTEAQYNALKKLSNVWWYAKFTYDFHPLPMFINYYKY